MTSTPGQQLLEQLLPEDLSGVVFVRDYLQLQFNPPPTINVYSKCRLVTKQASATFGDEAFANLIIGQIGQQVSGVASSDEVLSIQLANGSRIEVPFGPGTFAGPEAFVFWGRGEAWGVWP